MRRIVGGFVLLALGAAVAQAQGTAVIKQRQDLMKGQRRGPEGAKRHDEG